MEERDAVEFNIIEGLVSVDDHQVVVLMRCREDKEGALAHTRSQVLGEVLTAKKEFCSNTETAELFIPNPTFPVNTDLSVPLVNVTCSITRHEEGVISSDNTTIELHHLVHFEPYMYLPTDCLSDLFSIHPQPQKGKCYAIADSSVEESGDIVRPQPCTSGHH